MPNDTHDDIRRLLVDATADLPALAPSPVRTVRRAQRRVAATFSGIAIVIGLVVGGLLTAAGSFNRSMPADHSSTRGTWIDNLDTGAATRLEGVPRGAFWFDVSADGSTMAFAARSHERTQVFVSAPDGSGSHVVTHDAHEASRPALSPDGSTIAYQGFGHELERNVFVEDLATGRVRQLTHERRDVSELTWSPDGTEILYSMSIPGPSSAKIFDPGASSVLKIVDVASGVVRRIAGTRRSAADFGTWSSDREHIAYMTGHEWTDNAYGFNPAQIWIMGADGSDPRRLVTLNARAFGLAWTPAGNLSFTRLDGNSFNTYEMNVETRQITLIAAGLMPVWIDDHTVIVQR
jgi:Tol biopolymer transport system component